MNMMMPDLAHSNSLSFEIQLLQMLKNSKIAQIWDVSYMEKERYCKTKAIL